VISAGTSRSVYVKYRMAVLGEGEVLWCVRKTFLESGVASSDFD
jgi:hypothetical protein